MRHDHEAGLFAFQTFFNHHPGFAACVLNTGLIRGQHVVNRRMGFLQTGGNHHAFACGQTIGLDHDGRALRIHISVSRSRVFKDLVDSCRNLVALHEGLGKSLGALQLRGSTGRTKDAQTMGTEFVHHPGGQRCLGADDGQTYVIGLRPFTQSHDIGQGQHL